MIQQVLTTSFKKELLLATHDFSVGGDVFKIALYGPEATLNSSTSAYTTAFEIEDDGYTEGGATLTNVEPAQNGTVGYTSFETVTWASPTIVARGALIYNFTVSGYPSVMVLDFGMLRSSTGSSFTITFPTFNNRQALIRIT